MLISFVAEDKDKAQRRAFSFGIDLPEAGWTPLHEGIAFYAETSDPAGANISTSGDVAVRRNSALVVLNPKLGEAVGYQPAAPQLLQPGHWGPVDIKFRSAEDAALAFTHLGRDWAVLLCLVPVGSPGRE